MGAGAGKVDHTCACGSDLVMEEELLEFLDQAAHCIYQISLRAGDEQYDRRDLLLEAERLLQDVIIVSELLPPGDGDLLVSALLGVGEQ